MTDRSPTTSEGEPYWWGNDPYWTEALDALAKAKEAGAGQITIDLNRLDESLYSGDGPAYKLLDAMRSVIDQEGYDGFRGAPRLVLALLWRLQNPDDMGTLTPSSKRTPTLDQ
ncbi:MAG: hypothetical protein J0L58_01265 [Burkholderiales bacterium]|nr:hypothetical protein [Burkholderiales bacterium]